MTLTQHKCHSFSLEFNVQSLKFKGKLKFGKQNIMIQILNKYKMEFLLLPPSGEGWEGGCL